VKLLVADQFSEVGGAQLCVRDLLPAMEERGWRVYFFVPQPMTRYANGWKTPRDVVRYAFDWRRASARIREIVRAHGIDLILANGPRVLPATIGAGRPVVFYSHNILRKQYARMLAGWSLARTGAAAIAASRYTAHSLRGLVRPEQVEVIYSGVADLGDEPRGEREAPRVGLVGRIAPEKGQIDFVEAAWNLDGSGLRARFVIYGAARFASTSYEKRVRRAAEGAPVEFRGWTNPKEALGEVDIVAAPSMAHDAAPRVILEALSAGKPVVAYRSGGIPELIENGETGILTQAATPESLSASIAKLLDNPARRMELGRNARRAWSERFRVERYQREICEALERAALRAEATSARRW
jgi:glycosyltransferase involved in cell wall biosynthesis